MTERKKEARPDAGTSEQAKRESTFPSGNSQKQFITAANSGQGSITSLLMTGAENGSTLQDLVKLTGQDERSIRRQIQVERKAGQLILSDCKSGYFLPAAEDEVRRFIRSMTRRSREIAAVSRVAEDVLAGMGGQEKLEGW